MRPPDVVMWLDPGLTTGWAMLANGVEFSSDQCGFYPLGELVESYGRVYRRRMAISWERYIVTSGGSRTGTAAPSLETIGMVRWLCLSHDIMLLRPMPSSTRKLGSEEKLKQLGWYVPGKRHANDAAMHMLSWLLREGKLHRSLQSQLFTD